MAKNFYFDNFENSMEQDLLESLIVENISMHGHDIFYIPRTLIDKDDIYGEDTLSEYNATYMFEMYIKSYDSYEGDGTFLSKFNLEIRDSITFTVARRTFGMEVTGQDNNIIRPREGDLIYSPMMKRIFIIKFVDNYPAFFPLGALQTWDVSCDVFEYSSERFDTGIYEIDDLERKYSISRSDFGIMTNDGAMLADNRGFGITLSDFDDEVQLEDVYGDNSEIATESSGIVDWSDRDPFSSDADY